MRDLDTPEIHGYLPNFGYRVYTEKAIEMAGAAIGLTSNGHRAVASAPTVSQKPSKRKPGKRGTDGDIPEAGVDELIGEQYPGDAVSTPRGAD
jgi:arginine decarboxylase